MIHLEQARDAIMGLIALGGPVVALILALSVAAGAVVIVTLVQFRRAGVGRHAPLRAALAAQAAGSTTRAAALAEAAPGHLGALLVAALAAGQGAGDPRERLYARAEAELARLEWGFRPLDLIAQIAPLLGLFGTVLGMIDAFRAMQAAGDQVDPAVLAGGIWVALVTTAAGLAVAMPVSALLTWLEARMAAERRMAAIVIENALAPEAPRDPAADAGRAGAASPRIAHA